MHLGAEAAHQVVAEAASARQSTSSSKRAPTSRRPKNGASTLQSSLSPLSSGRRACGLYLWDAPGALLHAWCTRLMRDCVYEGRGGRKFVRIEPGSVLQLLYPCTRFSPDRCLICGGTFRDHLTLWWSKNLYTPLDRILDDTYRDGVAVVGDPSAAAGTHSSQELNAKSSQQKSPRRQGSRPSRKVRREATRHMSLTPSPSIEYTFHRRYVVEEEGTTLRGPGGKHVKVLVPRCEVHNDDDNRDGLHTVRSSRRRNRRDGEDGRREASPGGDSLSIFPLTRKYAFRMPKLPDVRSGATSLLVLARLQAVEALAHLLELEANDEARAARTR